MSDSAAILCIARNELPFTAEWLEYHLGLGFDHVYYVSTDADYSAIDRYFAVSAFADRVTHYHFDDFRPGWQMACYNAFFPEVRQRWVMIMDLDEFLVLEPFPTIQAFLGSVAPNVGQIQFPWLNVLSDRYFHARVFDLADNSSKHASDHVKSMVRCDRVAGLGIHAHAVAPSPTALSSGEECPRDNAHERFIRDTTYYRRFPFVLHLCSRGHYDVINRIVDHQFFNTKGGDMERNRLARFLADEPGWDNIPTRYLLAKFQESLPVVDVDVSLPALNANSDIGALGDIFLKHIAVVTDFECPNAEFANEAFECRYGLAKRLAQLDLAGACDVDEYLGCGSQLEYIGRLRQALMATGQARTCW